MAKITLELEDRVAVQYLAFTRALSQNLPLTPVFEAFTHELSDHLARALVEQLSAERLRRIGRIEGG